MAKQGPASVPIDVLILDGPSCAGKSSLARALQEALLPAHWLNVSFDTLVEALPLSAQERANQLGNWAGINGDLLYSAAFMLAGYVARQGQPVIFDIVLTNTRRATEMMTAFSGLDVFAVGLSCDWDELVRRAQKRGDRTLQEVEIGHRRSPRHLTYDLRLDSTNSSPDALASACLEFLNRIDPRATRD